MKKRQEDREKLLEEATEIYMKAGPREVFKFLVESGLPRSTALRWVHVRIPKLLKQGGVGEGSSTSTR
jgi:hypothetical protein